MIVDTKYMYRCIQLASKAKGHTSPNPMVGAVIVYNYKIIGEGYHQKAGEGHAEVNAIKSVKDKSLLTESTMYVSLEPCSHYGKTPPCAQLIIDSRIPTVIVGCLDPFLQVAGRGIKMLEDAGIKVKVGLLEKECTALNKEFNTAHTKGRPYIYLKWAQSKDGYIDRDRSKQIATPTVISNDFTKMLVHKLRAETDAIMIATNTAVADNPSLTTRLWYGHNPTRVVLDRTLRIPSNYTLYNKEANTIIITENKLLTLNAKNIEFLHIDYNINFLENLFSELQKRNILSIMIEGGAKFLQSLIDNNMWDEAFVEIAETVLKEGVEAPKIEATLLRESRWKESKHLHFAKSCL